VFKPFDLSDVKVALYEGYTSYFDPRCNESKTALTHMFEWMNTSVTIVNAEEIRNGILWNFELFAIPEGLGPTLESRLGEEAMDCIRDWVSAGGSYVGVRGSAAMAVKDSYFEGSTSSFYLALIDGISYEVEGLPQQSMINVSINHDCDEPDLSSEPDQITICSITGRYFKTYEGQEANIVANYTHINQPAMITARCGDGTVFLSSPHFEYEEDSTRDGTYYMDDFEDPDSEWPFMLKMCRWLVDESPVVRNSTLPVTTTTTSLTSISTIISSNTTMSSLNTTSSTISTGSTPTTTTGIEDASLFPIELVVIVGIGGFALVVVIILLKRK
jgi:glutamine amidotransferase-like uncharacterized protein